MSRYLFFIILLALSFSCGTSKKGRQPSTEVYEPLNSDMEVLLTFGNYDPQDAEFLGMVDVNNKAYPQLCDFQSIEEQVKTEARKKGANLVLAAFVTQPGFQSDCYGITARLYRYTDLIKLTSLKKSLDEFALSALPKEADYAVVNFYRPARFGGHAVDFDILMDGDKPVGKLKNGQKMFIKVNNFGQHSFMIGQDTINKVSITIEKGKEYYLRCALREAYFKYKPALYETDPRLAKFELAGIIK